MSEASRALGELERAIARGGPADAKLRFLRILRDSRLQRAFAVVRFHEALCNLRAYPDDARVLRAVERMLASFARRADLRASADELANSGIAGTVTFYPFFWPTARWIARHWPRQLELDRDDTAASENLTAALPLLVTPAEANALRERPQDGYAALDLFRARPQSDAVFLIRQVESMPGDDFTREAFHDRISPSYALLPVAGGPSRTAAKLEGAPFALRTMPLRRDRPNLRVESERAPRSVRKLSARGGEAVISLARSAMATRARDLDAFAYGDPGDVRIVDDGDGLAFAINGVTPERRTLLPAIFGGLTLRNGVPIGYLQLDVIGRSAALSFNTFPTFRGGEAAYTLARLIALSFHLFGAQSFSIEPYQLGQDNAEGLASGAWWFYYKLGFRPRASQAQRIARGELARIRKNANHRSSESTLKQLAQSHLFLELDPARPVPLPHFAATGFAVAKTLTRRGGGDRVEAISACTDEALRLTGIRSLRELTRDERAAWARWSALIVSIPGVQRWSWADRRALGRVFRAKAAPSETEFVRLFAAHAKLNRALLE